MSTYTFSTDGTTPGPTTRQPRTSRDLATDEWVMLNANSVTADYERCGWYPITEVPRPDADHLRSITHDGSVFTETWTFDQATADANADQADRDADAVALKDDLQNAKDVRDQAVQSRTDMDHETPDPAALPKWAPVAEDVLAPLDETVSRTGNQASQITNLQDALDALAVRVNEVTVRQQDSAQLANDLRIDNRRQYGDIRLLGAMLVRKFRKDRDDE